MWRLTALGALALLMAGCSASQTRIVLFEAVPSTAPHGSEVRLAWHVDNPGSRPGMDPCSLTRRAEGEEAQEPFPVACSAAITEVPPVGASASYVRYQLNVVKSPYDAASPYLTAVVTVNLEPSGPASVESVSIDQSDVELETGEQAALTATVSSQGGASTSVTWSSSDPTIASVDAATGLVTGTGEGTAQVTASSVFDPSMQDAVSVTVTFGDFGDGFVVATTVGPRQPYNREFVAIDGERVFYSRTRALDGTLLIGSVTVHERSASGGWVSTASLAHPPTATYRGFGDAIEARGSTAVVLGYRRVTTAPDVYESVLNVFDADAAGNWSRSAVLLEGEGIGTWIGSFPDITMALASDTLVVGLPRVYGDTPSEVRVYGRDVGGEGAWGVAATLAPPDTLSDLAADFYGTDVDLSEDGRLLAVVSSFQGSDACLGDTVFVYERSGTSPVDWTLIDALGSDQVGGCSTYVAVDGSSLAVTGIGANVVDLRIFQRGAGGGGSNDYGAVRTHTFTVPTYEDVAVFWAATSIRLRQNTIALGMVGVQCISIMPGQPCAPGLVQIVRRDAGGPGAWGVDDVLQGDPAYADQGFGVALDISADGRYLVVGTNPQPTTDPSRGGEVFVFER